MGWPQNDNSSELQSSCHQLQRQNPEELQEPLCQRKTFYIHHEWPRSSTTHLSGHMYVESLRPEKVTQPYPLIFIHGDFHSGKIWLDKPDGNPGWAAYFLRKGYHVYLVDLPGVGRSGKHPSVVGGNMAKLSFVTPLTVEQELTCPELYAAHQASAWETVTRHNQWPGTGQKGDPIFTQYMASVTVIENDRWERQTQAQEALSVLLQRTGKAILVGEGTGCVMAWLTTDITYELVAGVFSIEPSGPPFGAARGRGRLYAHKTTFDPEIREWGLADIPLTYDPPLTKPEVIIPDPTMEKSGSSLFSLCEYTHPDDPRKSCYLQNPIRVSDGIEEQVNGPPAQGEIAFHQLIHLKKVPHAVITAEASSHSIYDWATVAFMRQAGVQVSWIRLENLYILGNGRLMFLERNSNEIAHVLHQWMRGLPVAQPQVPPSAPVLEVIPEVNMENAGPLSNACVRNGEIEPQHQVQKEETESQHQVEGEWQIV